MAGASLLAVEFECKITAFFRHAQIFGLMLKRCKSVDLKQESEYLKRELKRKRGK